MQDLLFWLFPLIPVFGVGFWWLLVKRHGVLWFVFATLSWLGGHFAFFFMPDGWDWGNIGSRFGIIFGIVISVCYGGFILVSIKGILRTICIIVWLLTPLTLPGVVLMRDLPVSEQRAHCYISHVGSLLQTYYSNNNMYPSTITEDTFANTTYLNNVENACYAASTPSWYNPNGSNTWLLYQQQENSYSLGGSYRHDVLDYVGLTRVCHYNQATQDVSCGFNNWAPFSPP